MIMRFVNIEKKKAVMILSRVFPSTHPRAKESTGFEDKIKDGNKIHTIRTDANGAWKERCDEINSGKKYLSVREWSGKPYNSEQRELFRLDKIGYQNIAMTYDSNDSEPCIWINGKKVPVEEVAKNDGLSVDDFISWFFAKDNTFDGVVIHFTNYRY